MYNRLDINQRVLFHASCLIFLVLIIVTITTLYISQERNFHWWIDWYSATLNITQAFQVSLPAGWEKIQASLVSERNRLYTLPLVPFLLLFGKSRLVYELGLALVYLLPFSLVMGAIATRLIPVYRPVIFWATALLTLLIPVSWIPTFMGIPDTGGALFIALATWIYLKDSEIKRWWQVPSIGMAISLAVLLRRHFVYGSIALLGAITLQSLFVLSWDIYNHRTIPWQRLGGILGRIGLIALIHFIIMTTIAPEFTNRALTTNYRNLYTSWSFPIKDMVELYISFYGGISWLIVVTGFGVGIWTRSLVVPSATLMGLSGILSLIIWLGVLRYANVFYSLHITPLIVIGGIACLWTIWSRLRQNSRTLLISVISSYLVINLLLGLTPIGTMSSQFRPWFGLSMPPLVRTDYDEVVQVVDYLRKIAPNDEPIYVVGYQRLNLSPSVLSAAESIIYGQKKRILNILRVPQVDSRDTYPIEALLKAQYVVVPNSLPDYPGNLTLVPTVGEWLPQQEVDVVHVVFDAFTQNQEIAQDFQPLPTQFQLEGGSLVTIYQRIHPTRLVTAIRTMSTIQQQIGTRPGGQLDWMNISQTLQQAAVWKNSDNTYKVVAYYPNSVALCGKPVTSPGFDTQKPMGCDRANTETVTTSGFSPSRVQPTFSFLYLGTLPQKAEVRGKVTVLHEPCVGLSLQLAMIDANGEIISTKTQDYLAEDSSEFSLSIQGQNPAYLLLDGISYTQNNRANYCTIAINSLTVSPQPLPTT